MASTADHIAARSDYDLIERFIAAAEQAGHADASTWVPGSIGQLISVAVQGEQTIADVHAYATLVRAEALAAVPPSPGLNPSAVTDAHLSVAITALRPPVEGVVE